MLGIGKIVKIEGKISEISQSMIGEGEQTFSFLTIDSDDGTAYRIKRVWAGADVSHEIRHGNHVTIYLMSLRHVFTAFFKRNTILAVEGSRGISFGIRLSSQIATLFSMTFMLGFLSLIWSFIVLGTIDSGMRYHDQSSTSAFFAFLIWMTPVWLSIHFLATIVAIMVKSNLLKARLLGTFGGGAVGKGQVLRNGKILKEI